MKTFGEIVKSERKKRKMLLRESAAALKLDQSLISKFESNSRKPTREQVIQFAKLYKIDKNELLAVWLSDKIFYEVYKEDIAKQALHIAEKKIDLYLKNK